VTTHVLREGEWLGLLAERYGLGSASAIWNAPENEPLRTLRASADLVMAGDTVHIPTEGPTHVEVAAGRRASFILRSGGEMLRVRVVGIASFVRAFGGIDYELTVGAQTLRGELTTDGQVLEMPLPVTATSGELVLMGSLRYEIPIGGLGPVEEPRGALGRLAHLGFTAVMEPGDEADTPVVQAVDPLRAALRRFQRHAALPPNGELDEPTKARLRADYGA